MTGPIRQLPPENRDWLDQPGLQAVFDAIEAAGGEARIAGGAVRNALMGYPVADVDLSTTLKPTATVAALEAAGLRAVPTGIEHGTVTAVSDHTGYEITTLRQDVETDGRRAKVEFGSDWEADARRRDLTINALYCLRTGEIYDPLNGLPDIEKRVIRFIGDAEERIGEDHLRILRFFRFFAWYGDGRPDAAGIKACARLKAKLKSISAERIWMELFKLLSAPDPGRALLWMRTTGVLTVILPESEKWGIDLIPSLVAFEDERNMEPDPVIRIEAMVPPDPERVTAMARRLRMSRQQEKRLLAWSMAHLPENPGDHDMLAQTLYRGNPNAIVDRLVLEGARLVSKGGDGAESLAAVDAALAFSRKWKRPELPVAGADLIAAGVKKGPDVGRMLRRLEAAWIDSGFKLGREELIGLIP